MWWNLLSDMFEFCIFIDDKFIICRGVLLIVNSFFDLLGFFLFVIISGKFIFRDVVICILDWDELLLDYILVSWEEWSLFLKELEKIYIFRIIVVYFSKVVRKELWIYVDVLEKVIVVVFYMKVYYEDGFVMIGFLLGKFKVVLVLGYIIFCLEFCVVVLVIEIL